MTNAPIRLSHRPELRKPVQLQRGDRVATITLSWGGAGTFPWRYEAGKRQLEDAFDVQVVETRHAMRDAAWIERNPRARADDLMEAFADPSIRGIVSIIGGNDSVRLLPYLDLEVIRANPKVFLGYSDTTVSHFACWKAGLSSFYGPAMMAGFGENGGLFPYMAESVRRTLFVPETVGRIEPNRDGWTVEMLDWANPALQTQRRKLQPSTGPRLLQGRGRVQGHLLGGCTEVLEVLKGTPYWPSLEEWTGAMLFLETSEEAPSPGLLTRWLRNYAAQGILERVSGILFGRPGGPVDPAKFGEYDAALLRVVREECGLTELPILTNLDFGHTDPMFVLPYGALAEIDCEQVALSILEPGVVTAA